jgi:hypothetical protein
VRLGNQTDIIGGKKTVRCVAMEMGVETTAGYIPTSRTSSYFVQNPEKRKEKK